MNMDRLKQHREIEPDKLLTVRDVSNYTGLTYEAVQQAIRSGRLAATINEAGHRRIVHRDVDSAIRRGLICARRSSVGKHMQTSNDLGVAIADLVETRHALSSCVFQVLERLASTNGASWKEIRNGLSTCNPERPQHRDDDHALGDVIGGPEQDSVSVLELDENDWLTVAEIEDRFGVSNNSIRRAIGNGLLPAVKRGSLKIRLTDARALFEQRDLKAALQVEGLRWKREYQRMRLGDLESDCALWRTIVGRLGAIIERTEI